MRPDPPTSGKPSTLPLFHAAWLFAAGIALSRALWLRPGVLFAGVLLMMAICAATALFALRIRWLSLAALWMLLGLWCAEMQPAPTAAPALLHASDGLVRTVEGVVVDAGLLRSEVEETIYGSASESSTQRVDLGITSLEVLSDTEDEQQPADGEVRLTIRWPSEQAQALQTFHCGERLRALVRLYPPEVYRDPGAWSRAEYLLEQGITSTASVHVEHVERLGVAPGYFFKCRLGEWQHESAARLLALPAAMRKFPPALQLSEDDAIMLAAMITGDRTMLSSSLRAGFERTGSFHMLVVSGLHLSLIAGLVFWLAGKLRIPRVPATFVTIAAAWAYALLTGFATPVQRALCMVSLYLVGRLFFRERGALNTIGFAALVMLCASPRSLFDASFQMTLLAVVAIGGIAAPMLHATIGPYIHAMRDLRRVALDNKLEPRLAQYRVILRMIAARLQKAGSKWIGWTAFPWAVRVSLRLVEMLAVTAIVELAMTLPMAVYFHRITIFALPVNLLIVPLLTVLLPFALLTWMLLLVAPAFAAIPAAATALLLHAGVGIVRHFGSLSLGDWRTATPLSWQIAVFCALLATAMVLAATGRWSRRGAWAALACAALAAVASRPAQHPAGALLVEAIDVGQGDSLLLITPDGKTLLVDGGGFGGGLSQAKQPFDIGEEVVSQALWARGIRHLDAVALSHAHADHMSGLPAVLRNFHPSELWVGNNPKWPDYDALLDEAHTLHTTVRTLHAGDSMQLGSAHIRVLAPTAEYQPGPEPSNNDSLVLRVAYGETSVLLEGDAEGPVEQAMLAEPDLASTLLKVGHHGSVTSTHPEFLSRVSPKWAVISCGLNNHYGHPREEILQELEDAGVRTFSTDIHGATCFALDGKQVTAQSECGYAKAD
jgi:competence protein ComEC